MDLEAVVPQRFRTGKTTPAGYYKQTPYYNEAYVPKDPVKNLEWRIHILEAALHDKGLQKDIRQACFDDVLFFFNSMCYCFEPRAKTKIKPFCTWLHQDPAIIIMDGAIDKAENSEGDCVDVVVEKSRGQGASWMFLMIILRRWLKDPMFSAGLVTKNEKLVDSARDTDTLMWKIAWMIKKLPFWMLPEGFDMNKHRNLSEHTLFNPEMESTIVGYPATGDVARGGRKTVFAFDELAAFNKGTDYDAMDSTQHVSDCRFLVSTHKGSDGAYYDATVEDGNAIKVILDWKDNPSQNKKLYKYSKGHIVQLDKEKDGKLHPHEIALIKEQHKKLRKRKYSLEGTVRNIWYNKQCLRAAATPQGIAQELDMDPHGSVSKVFNTEIIQDVKTARTMPPLIRGKLCYNPDTCEVIPPYIQEADDGELELWVDPLGDGTIPVLDCIAGVDIASGNAGDYTNNSVVSILNKATGEQLLEWASNSHPPPIFAKVCVALGKWFNNALVVVESNYDPGFRNYLIDDHYYPNLYYAKVDNPGEHKRTKKMGYHMTKDKKFAIFMKMQNAMADGTFVPRSEKMLNECFRYENKNGKIEFVAIGGNRDEMVSGVAHGDRVIASAIAYDVLDETPGIFDDEENLDSKAPQGSMAARLKDYDEKLDKQKDDIWESGRMNPIDKEGLDYNDWVRDPWS